MQDGRSKTNDLTLRVRDGNKLHCSRRSLRCDVGIRLSLQGCLPDVRALAHSWRGLENVRLG